MQIQLSWDLFIMVVFLIVLSYSFIIGKTNTIKLVISSYVSILTADAIGNMLNNLFLTANPLIDVLQISGNSPALIIVKLTIFVTSMVVLATKGAFEITLPKEEAAMEFLITFFFGALSAVLMISSILVFSSGSSFIMGGTPISQSNIAEMYNQSRLVQMIAMNYNIWFALPVVSFIVMSTVKTEESKIDEEE